MSHYCAFILGIFGTASVDANWSSIWSPVETSTYEQKGIALKLISRRKRVRREKGLADVLAGSAKSSLLQSGLRQELRSLVTISSGVQLINLLDTCMCMRAAL
jgi:hypothetical protein